MVSGCNVVFGLQQLKHHFDELILIPRLFCLSLVRGRRVSLSNQQIFMLPAAENQFVCVLTNRHLELIVVFVVTSLPGSAFQGCLSKNRPIQIGEHSLVAFLEKIEITRRVGHWPSRFDYPVIDELLPKRAAADGEHDNNDWASGR